jgi:hypothetical protein
VIFDLHDTDTSIIFLSFDLRWGLADGAPLAGRSPPFLGVSLMAFPIGSSSGIMVALAPLPRPPYLVLFRHKFLFHSGVDLVHENAFIGHNFITIVNVCNNRLNQAPLPTFVSKSIYISTLSLGLLT